MGVENWILRAFRRNAAKVVVGKPYEGRENDEDSSDLRRLGEALARLEGAPLKSIEAISEGLGSALEALSVWDAIEKFARANAALSARGARRQGATWQRIGDAVRVSKSAALQRYDPTAKKKRRALAADHRNV